MEHRPLNVLLPGQELSTRFREASGQVLANLQRMRLTPDNGNPYASVWVTHVDQAGISIHITRGATYGGDIEAFIPRNDVQWQTYFSPLKSSNQGYVRSRHYQRRFPLDFI